MELRDKIKQTEVTVVFANKTAAVAVCSDLNLIAK